MKNKCVHFNQFLIFVYLLISYFIVFFVAGFVFLRNYVMGVCFHLSRFDSRFVSENVRNSILQQIGGCESLPFSSSSSATSPSPSPSLSPFPSPSPSHSPLLYRSLSLYLYLSLSLCSSPFPFSFTFSFFLFSSPSHFPSRTPKPFSPYPSPSSFVSQSESCGWRQLITDLKYQLFLQMARRTARTTGHWPGGQEGWVQLWGHSVPKCFLLECFLNVS